VRDLIGPVLRANLLERGGEAAEFVRLLNMHGRELPA